MKKPSKIQISQEFRTGKVIRKRNHKLHLKRKGYDCFLNS